jgi:hypothetical protein
VLQLVAVQPAHPPLDAFLPVPLNWEPDFMANVDIFLVVLAEPHLRHLTISLELNTSCSNSCPQSSHTYSYMGM